MPIRKKRYARLERSPKSSNKIVANVILVIVIAAIVLVGVLIFSTPKNCGTDEACFRAAAENCKLAKLTSFKGENTFSYEIRGSRGNNCLVTVEIIKISDGASVDLKQAFEGKNMICNIPRQQFTDTSITEIDNIIDYCTGPLKEAMLEVMIKELYSIIANNLGSIVIELEDLIK